MSRVWKEPNLMRYVGFRPALEGDQACNIGTVSNASFTLLTVPADKVFLLFSFWAYTLASAAGIGYMSIYNAVPAVAYRLAYHRFTAAGDRYSMHDLSIPIEIPAGWSVVIETNNATTRTEGWVYGITIDAA